MTGCSSGKKPFVEKKHAKKFLKRRPQFADQSVYRCPECDMWHLTSASAQAKRFIREALR